MGIEDHAERLARIEAIMTGVQAEIAAMREALTRLVRIEEQMQARAERERDLRRLIDEQHDVLREDARRLHERLDAIDARLDESERRIETMRGPLVWLAGIAASVVAGLVSLLVGRLA